MELQFFCCKAELKTFLKSRVGAEKNEKRRVLCSHEIYKHLETRWDWDKELPLIKGFPFIFIQSPMMNVMAVSLWPKSSLQVHISQSALFSLDAA